MRADRGLARTAARRRSFELLARYAARDFRDIGHKAIYVANSLRTLDVIGWQHAEPVLRSLAYALLYRDGASGNPAESDLPADRPYRQNLEAIARRRARIGWRAGRMPMRSARCSHTFRSASPQAASDASLAVLNRGVSPRSVFEACFAASAELLMRQPGIVALHAATTHERHALCSGSNAVTTGPGGCCSCRMRRSCRSSAAASGQGGRRDRRARARAARRYRPRRDRGDLRGDRARSMMAARKMLTFLKARQDPTALAAAARRLIFLKGTDSHDYKYSSAVFEDHALLTPAWRDRYLAAAAFHLQGSRIATISSCNARARPSPDSRAVHETRRAE